MKLSPPLEEEEGFATRVVDDAVRNYQWRRAAAVAPAAPVTQVVELDEKEYNTLAKVLGNDTPGGFPLEGDQMDVEITDDEDEATPGDDGDSAVGGIGAAGTGTIKRKRTVRVVIRSRAFI